jgi:transcriptional regulator with XRE-family HTH domain
MNNDLPLHPLRAYRKAERVTLITLAKRVGTTEGTLSRIESGSRTPSLSMVARIIRATGGKVRADDFIPKFRVSARPPSSARKSPASSSRASRP